jgi:ferritin-like metal-binding protein YciE
MIHDLNALWRDRSSNKHEKGATMSEQALKDLLIEELQDTYNAETQILEALPKMAQAASSEQLKQAFQTHHQETQGQIQRLEQIFQKLNAQPGGNTCEATQGLIEEAEELIGGGHPPEVLDVALVMSAQKVEHYEIASYGSLRALAQTCGMTEVAQLLEQTLDEEKATDEKLNKIAEGEINAKALKAA